MPVQPPTPAPRASASDFVPLSNAEVDARGAAGRTQALWQEIAWDLGQRVALTGIGAAFAYSRCAAISSPVLAATSLTAVASTPLGLAGIALVGCVAGSLCLPRLSKSLPMHALLGLSLGVLIAPTLGCGGPVVQPLLAAMLTASTALQTGLCAASHGLWSPSWTTIPLALTAAACVSVMAYDAALGAGALAVGLHVGLAGVAAWSMSATALAVISNASMLLPQQFVQKLRVDAAVVEAMRLEGFDPQPTILQPPAALCASLRRLRRLSLAPEPGLPIYALCGSAGTGKTLLAQGIAQALGGDLVLATPNRLRRVHIPLVPLEIINLIALFGQADMHAQTKKRQTVLVVDEADTLLTAPKGPNGFPSPVHVVALFMLRVVFDNHARTNNRLSVVFVTNHIEPMRGWLAKVNARIVTVQTPDAAARIRMATAQLQALHDAYRKRGIALDLMHGEAFDAWCDAVAGTAWQGRDIAASIACVARSIDAARFDAGLRFDADAAAQAALMAGCGLLQTHEPEPNARPLPVDEDTEALYAEVAGLGAGASESLAQAVKTLVQGLMQLQLDPAKQAILRQSLGRMDQAMQYLNARLFLS